MAFHLKQKNQQQSFSFAKSSFSLCHQHFLKIRVLLVTVPAVYTMWGIWIEINAYDVREQMVCNDSICPRALSKQP